MNNQNVTLKGIKMKLNYSPKNLSELKTKLRNKYPQLTDADVYSTLGNEKDMLRMIEYKLRKTKEEMLDIIAGL